MDYAEKINSRRTVSKPLTPERKPKSPTGVSLKDLFHGDLPEETQDALESSGSVEVDPSRHSTVDEIREAWSKWCAKLEEDNRKGLLAMLSGRELELDAEQSIHLTVQTEFQKKEIHASADETLDFLKKELDNPALSLKVEVSEASDDDDSPAYYTDKEKYKNFVEQNPALEKLRKSLGLDVDF